MHDDQIRRHISAVAKRDEPQTRDLMGRIQRVCWPSGEADHTHPAALSWVRRWAPARAATVLPVCSCAVGCCAVCN